MSISIHPINTIVLTLLLCLPVAVYGVQEDNQQASSQPVDENQEPTSSAETPATEENHHHAARTPRASLGSYAISRELSGTSWQPESTPMTGKHFSGDELDLMIHGFVDFGWQEETSARGESDGFSTSMLMVNGNRSLGPGRMGLRFMGSVEPAMGSRGYPVLFQTGETFDGVNPLIDRQHPHDAVMELAATYSLLIGEEQSVFIYVAPVGEPALGPGPFMMRTSSGGNPIAPIRHHWMDATHITYGVVTGGWVPSKNLKIEASVFNGLEPDDQ